jgi:hypothetical protein
MSGTAPLPVLGPGAAQAEILPGLDAEEVADNGDEVLLARHGQPHHAPGVLLVDVGDALKDALHGCVRAGARAVLWRVITRHHLQSAMG